MKKKTIVKILLYTFSIIFSLILILGVHIYMVYRPKVTHNTRVMARIDIKQSINQLDANKISAWLAHEKGVDHFLVNQQNSIVIFTFYPIKNSGKQIVEDFKANFNYKADRFVPTAENLEHSCPVAASSYTYKIYKLISQII
jgi:hypothetical protein